MGEREREREREREKESERERERIDKIRIHFLFTFVGFPGDDIHSMKCKKKSFKTLLFLKKCENPFECLLDRDKTEMLLTLKQCSFL